MSEDKATKLLAHRWRTLAVEFPGVRARIYGWFAEPPWPDGQAKLPAPLGERPVLAGVQPTPDGRYYIGYEVQSYDQGGPSDVRIARALNALGDDLANILTVIAKRHHCDKHRPTLRFFVPCKHPFIVGFAEQPLRDAIGWIVEVHDLFVELSLALNPEDTKPKRMRGLPKAELNTLVANYLTENRNRWQRITAQEIADRLNKQGYKTSKAAVVGTPAWKAFEQERKARRPSKPRTVSLTDKMQAAIADPKASDPARDAELARLIREQEADREADERPYRRRSQARS